MLEQLTELPAGIVGVAASGTLSKGDYERVIEPLLEQARQRGERIKFLYRFTPAFEGFTAGAAWEDARLGFGALRLFQGCAIVGDVGWIREASNLLGVFAPCPMRTFTNAEFDAAVAWLDALPTGGGTTHRLLADTGVLVVEVQGPLHIQDFDALAATADPWIETHGRLRGLVIHTRQFPGWETLGGLFRHITFVREHHRSVRRVALVTNSTLANLARNLAEHFVKADVEHFEHDALERAITWAGEDPPGDDRAADHPG